MEKIIKVEQFYNKNQFLINAGVDGLYFQSYDSLIAIIKDGILTLGKRWDYSNTTRKHLYLFLNDCYYISGLNCQKNKRQYIQNLIDNGHILYDENLE